MTSRGYGQFCPIAKASEITGERWTNLLIRELGAGSNTFNDLRKGLPLMSPSLLSTRLKSLVQSGIVERLEESVGIRYRLTESGRELQQVVLQLGNWGQRWARSDLSHGDLDPSLLMWDIHRSIDVGYFHKDRTTLMFEFTDYTSKLRRWWMVVKDKEVDICLKDPGYKVDLEIVSDVKTLTAYWMGEISMTQALREKRIQLSGDSGLKHAIRKWMGRNYFSDVKPG